MTDLNALVVFAKVVEAKSFSEAARRLGMPVSTVSRRVAELEDQLGVRLHLGNRNIPRPMRLFKEFAARMAPTLFQQLPT